MVGDPAPITQSAEEPGEKGSGTISQISGATLAPGGGCDGAGGRRQVG